MKQKEAATKNQLVIQSNALINSAYSMSLAEKRIMLFMISQIHKDDKDFKPYRMNIKDFMNQIGTKAQNEYERAREITKSMITRAVEINDGDKLIQVALLSSAIYYKGSGYVELKFDPELKPYLLQLKEKFTVYQIQNILPLQSIYSIRIYELLKQFEKLKERIIKMSDLKKILKVEEQYDRYNDFKRFVILQARRELSQNTDISFEFEEIKLGRKIDSIKFIIKHKPQLEQPEPELEIKEKPEETIIENTKQSIILNKLLDLGVENTKALNFIQIKDLDTLDEQIEYAEKQYKTKKVHSNLGGYLVSIIEKDANVKNDYDKKLQEKEKQQKELEKQKQEKEKLLIKEYETEFQEERNTKLAQLMPDINEEILKEYYSDRMERRFVFDSKGNFKFESAVRFFRIEIAKENNIEYSDEAFKKWVKQNKNIELGQKTVNGLSEWVIIGKQLSLL